MSTPVTIQPYGRQEKVVWLTKTTRSTFLKAAWTICDECGNYSSSASIFKALKQTKKEVWYIAPYSQVTFSCDQWLKIQHEAAVGPVSRSRFCASAPVGSVAVVVDVYVQLAAVASGRTACAPAGPSISFRMFTSLFDPLVFYMQYVQPAGWQWPLIFSRYAQRRLCNSDAVAAQNSKNIMNLLHVYVPATLMLPVKLNSISFFFFALHLLIFYHPGRRSAIYVPHVPPFRSVGGEKIWQWADWKTWVLLFNFPLQFCFMWASEEEESSRKPSTHQLKCSPACHAARSKSVGVERSADFKNT